MKSIQTEAYNSINIVGKVLTLVTRSGKTSMGKPYESVNLVVRVNDEIEGKKTISEIPISFFASPYTNSGAENPLFKNLQKIKELHSIQDYGLDGASFIRLSKANLQENFFVSRGGQLIDTWQIRGAFCNTVKEGAKEEATFNIDGFILDIKDEVNREGDTTGRLIFKVAVVQYSGNVDGGNVDIFDLIVEDPDKINYLQRLLEVGQTFRFAGHIRYTTEQEQRATTASSWGEAISDEVTRTVRELIVTGGGEAPYDEDFGYDPLEIKKALNARKAKMEQAQIDAKPKATASTRTGKYDWE